MNKILTVIALVIVISCTSQSGESTNELKSIDHDWERYGRLLESFNHDGLIDYAGLKSSRAILDSLVDDISLADQSNLSHPERLAFYINAYNILTLRAIIDAYPVKSIKDIDGVWDDKNWLVSGQKISINQIEHEILRKEFDEPRIHVAVNCASISCPPLAAFPFSADSLESQLSLMSIRFAKSATHNQIDLKRGEANLSAIFDWYGDDFIARYYQPEKLSGLSKKKNASLWFILSNLDPADTLKSLSGQEFEVEYGDYNWNLNEYSGE